MQDELEHLFSNITQLDKLVSQQSQKSIEEQQATLLQFTVLSRIKESNTVTMGELAEKMHMSLSSATQLVERLVKNRLLIRSQDSGDRRITKITLTSEGKKQYTKIKKELLQHMQTIFENVPEIDRRQLIRITDELIITLKQKV